MSIFDVQVGSQLGKLAQKNPDAAAMYVGFRELDEQNRADLESEALIYIDHCDQVGAISALELLYKVGKYMAAKNVSRRDVQDVAKAVRERGRRRETQKYR